MGDQSNRVAVTGYGVVSSLGSNADATWENALKAKSGISLIEQMDTSQFNIKIGGEVKNFKLSPDILSEREQDRYDRFIHFALQAADEALKKANASELPYDPLKVGSILGVGMGGFPMIESQHTSLMERGPRRVGPFFIPGVIPNMTTGLISIIWKLKGINYSIASACASAGHAISAASYEIASGRQDMMITGGAESVICGLPLAGFMNMKALSKRNEEPHKASRPFDKGRDGFVMGEGSCVLILENLEKARARGANIIAEVVGHGSSSDAYHITAPHPEGEGASECMKTAISSAGIDPNQIDYINAHGTSTPLGDIAETNAIKKVFNDHAYNLVVSSTKSMTGHLLGAAAAIESFFCIKAIEQGIIPPTANLEDQDEQCDLNYAANEPIKKKVNYALNNSFGFGGTNSCLIYKSVDN